MATTKDLPWEHRRGDPQWLGGSKWKTRWFAGKDVAGKERSRTITFYADGIEKARKVDRAKKAYLDSLREAGAQTRGTFGELCNEWAAMKKRTNAATTQYAVEIMLGRIRRELGKIPLEKLTARDLDRYYSKLLDAGLSPSTANHHHRIINSMLRQAHKWGSVTGNVAMLATPPRKPPGAHIERMPTPAALMALIREAPPSLFMAAFLATATGARRGELVGLRWSDIDGYEMLIQRSLFDVPGQKLGTKMPKSNQTRFLTLDDHTLDVLTNHRSWLMGMAAKRGSVLAADGPILAKIAADGTGRTPYPPGWITQEWTKLCAKRNVELRFHGLRHFHATQLIDARVPVSAVSARLGHSKISTTTDIYTKALKPSDSEAARAIGDVMRG